MNVYFSVFLPVVQTSSLT